MKPTVEKHQDFKSRVRSLLREIFPNGFYLSLDQKTRLIYNCLLSSDFSFVDSMMMDRYSVFGPAPRQPSCLFRSLILSIENGCVSVVSWASLLKSSPFFCHPQRLPPRRHPGGLYLL